MTAAYSTGTADDAVQATLSRPLRRDARSGQIKKALPASGIIDTGVTVIDKSNVDSFRAELTEMKKPAQ